MNPSLNPPCFSVALVGVLVLTVSLAGCGATEDEQLTAWMAEQRSSLKPRVTPLVPPKKFVPEDYVQAGALDPFSSIKLTSALKKTSKKAGNGDELIKPEANRRKEPLELVPLDTVGYVGNLLQNGQRVALLRIGTLLHQVKVGDYIGLNYGKILKISESEIVLREIVQDLDGEWSERSANLQLLSGGK